MSAAGEIKRKPMTGLASGRNCRRRKLTKEMVDAFVEKIYFYSDGNLEIHLKYDDFMEQLTEIAEERIVGRI